VRLDGFRPGKVPLKVIEQKYGKQVRLEVVDQLVNSTLQEALTQENMRPAGVPDIEPRDSQPGEPLEYVAVFEVFPEITGTIVYDFSVTRPAVEIADSDVTAMLENLRTQRATWNEIDQPAQLNNQVSLDFEGTVDGESFSGNKAEKLPLVLGSNSMIPGFEEQLTGLSAGEEKTLDITFPDDYPSAEVAGKAAKFKVKVHAVLESVLPELNDDFASAFGVGDGGIGALKAEVTNNMQRELKGLVASKLKEQVFTGLLDRNPIEVPGNLVDGEIERLKQQEGGQSMEASALEESALRRVKLGVLVSEIVKQNQLQVDPDKVRALIESIASSYEKPEEVVQWYYGDQNMLSGVQSAVIEEQVVEWVVEHSDAKVIDKATGFSDLVEEARQSKG
jgi:trigger factor